MTATTNSTISLAGAVPEATAAAGAQDARSDVSGNSWLNVVQARIQGLRYGVVQIVVHDGRVTQVECTEKVRFEAARSPGRELAANGSTTATTERRPRATS